MNHQQKLEAVEQKIIETVPGITVVMTVTGQVGAHYYHVREILLADVLVAIRSTRIERWFVDYDGMFWYEDPQNKKMNVGSKNKWDMAKPYSDQSPELIDFLSNVFYARCK